MFKYWDRIIFGGRVGIYIGDDIMAPDDGWFCYDENVHKTNPNHIHQTGMRYSYINPRNTKLLSRKVTDLWKKEVIHCKTEEEANRICKLMHDAGLKWRSWCSYLVENNYGKYLEDTCYYPNNWEYSDKNYYVEGWYTIYPSTDFPSEEKCCEEKCCEEKCCDPVCWGVEVSGERLMEPKQAREMVKEMYCCSGGGSETYEKQNHPLHNLFQ